MNLKVFPIIPVLQPYLRKVWVFESQYDVALSDIKTVVPSGHITLTFTLKGNYNSLVKFAQSFHTKESTISLIGHQTGPVQLSGGGHVITVGVSFKPYSAYRFFPFALQETANLIVSGEELFGQEAESLADQLATLGQPALIAHHLQQFLAKQLQPANKLESLARYSIEELFKYRGQLRIQKLTENTGYSQRHVNRTFHDLVGISPKHLARIIRIKHLLSSPSTSSQLSQQAYYDDFFDQAHFIKEFRSFTGFTPHKYTQADNSFGALFNQVE